MNYKVIFLDLDGTCLNRQRQISKLNQEILTKLNKNGVKVIITTGRPYCSSLGFYYELNLDSYLISDNGATISKPNDPNFMQIAKTIPYRTHLKFFNAVKDITLSALFNIKHDVYIYEDKGYLDYFKNEVKYHNLFVGEFSKFSIAPTGTLYLIRLEDNQNFLGICKKFKNLRTHNWGVYDGKVLYEVYYYKNNKGVAVKRVLKLLKLKPKQALCFGDNNNDLPMFKSVGSPVAMQNATPELKKYARFVTSSSNDDDGIYHFLTSKLKLGTNNF